MKEEQIKPSIQRCATTDIVTLGDKESKQLDVSTKGAIKKAVSMDSGEAEISKMSNSCLGSLKRRSVRKRTSKRSNRQEPGYGHDTETYEKIRERVLQERAVTNAIDALQERWRMLTFMYEDCVKMNQTRKERKLKKLCVKRQFELIMVVSTFALFCLFLSVLIFVLLNIWETVGTKSIPDFQFPVS
ncbi:uncharacterized protein LOC132729970 [Ruditapes philippinarum]|uniref:uncharacterized protein LOC132729970 n=1 Tax=Ruditapes philippinarum TaxID=129788 RepID=UPI00295BF222|nr:uncharacterized protein LOC132729970 [Ruditapes philippinarum]